MSFNKEGIGYNPLNKKKTYKNSFVHKTSKDKPHTICNYYLRKGHISYSCPLRNPNTKIIQVWVPKETRPQNMFITYIGPEFDVKARKVCSIVLWVCLKVSNELWYLDCGYSRHMSGNESLFIEIKKKKHENVNFDDNRVAKIILIGKDPYKSLENVYLDEGLKFNLLSISQLCDTGNNVILTLLILLYKMCMTTILFYRVL